MSRWGGGVGGEGSACVRNVCVSAGGLYSGVISLCPDSFELG